MTSAPSHPDDPRMRGFRDRADVAEVLDFLEARTTPLGPEIVPSSEALGRVLAESIVSPISVPPFDRAAMDGFAVVAEDTFGATEYGPAQLEVIGRSLPGHPFGGTVTRSRAVRIMTGAPVPDGADAVIEVERTRSLDERTVSVVGAVTPGKHVGKIGEDVTQGTTLFDRGHRLRPQDLGLLASTTINQVTAYRRPRVALLATGNELVSPGVTPAPNQIVDSNTPMLAALVGRDSGVVTAAQIIPDDRDSIREVLAHPDCDLAIVTGGSSVGEEDFAPEIVHELGELVFHGIAMRPSGPTGIGFIDQRPVFLLPGNPVSALCAYDFFAGPTLRALSGRTRAWPHPRVQLPLASKITSSSGRVDYVRVTIETKGTERFVRPLMVSGASILSSTTRAAGVVIVARDVEGIPAGVTVEVFLYE